MQKRALLLLVWSFGVVMVMVYPYYALTAIGLILPNNANLDFISLLPTTTTTAKRRRQLNILSPLASLSCTPTSTPTNNKTSQNQTALMELNMSQAMLLHIGKAGGGSIIRRLKETWGFDLPPIHPTPKPGRLASKEYRNAFLVVAIRDPIDRFISAFNWRTVVLCKPFNETRKFGAAASHGAQKFCKQAFREETDILFFKYNQSAERLALAMCDDDDDNDNSGDTESQGQQDVKRIQHASYSIQDWLTTTKTNKHATKSTTQSSSILSSGTNDLVSLKRVLPLVLEPGFDLDLQSDATVALLQDQLQLEQTAAFETRIQHVHRMDCQAQTNPSPAARKARHLHSSVHHGKQPTVLSEKALVCLRKFYAQDYVILRQIKDESCPTDECRRAIQSILDRRGVSVE